jgi:hypothetical protein
MDYPKPTRLIKELRSRETGTPNERTPFSDEEIKRMFEACETRYGKTQIRWSRKTHHHEALGETVNYRCRWNGQDLADFIAVSIYTGLRISDDAHIPYRSIARYRRVPYSHDEKRTQGFYVGSRLVAGEDKSSDRNPWPANIRHPRNQGFKRRHRSLAQEAETSVGPLRAVAGEADTASLPPYFCANTPVESERDRA